MRQLLTLAASLGGLALVLAGLMRGAGMSAAAPRSPSPSGPERAPVTPHSLAPSSAEIPVTALIPTAPPITASAAALAPSRAAPVARVRPPSVASGSLLATANEALLAGRIQEACSLAEKAAASPGASPRVWKFLGQCFMRLGARAKGVAYYQRYLELAPSGPDAVFVREMIK